MGQRVVIPPTVKAQVVSRVKEQLEDAGYFSQGMFNSTVMLDDMTADPQIGGVLAQYMRKDKVRTYIKDCIIGKYAKKKNGELLSTERLQFELEKREGPVLLQADKNQVVTFIAETDGCFIFAAKGTVLKWESALRKVLEKRVQIDTGEEEMQVKTYLILSNTGRLLTDSERENLNRTLGLVNVKVIIINA